MAQPLLVLGFATEPVTAMIRARARSRPTRPRSWSALKVSSNDQQRRLGVDVGREMRHDRRRGTGAQRGRDEIVTIVVGSAQRHEQVTGLDGPVVDGDPVAAQSRVARPLVAAAASPALHSAGVDDRGGVGYRSCAPARR